jgi:hypothetical protein
MTQAIRIDPERGAISIEGLSRDLAGGLALDIVRAELAPFIRRQSASDSYNRIECFGLSFGGWPSDFIATFKAARLELCYWRISRMWPYETNGWPSETETTEQMAVLRQTLQSQLARTFQERFEYFVWGQVGCLPDLHTEAPNVTVTYEVGAGDQPAN